MRERPAPAPRPEAGVPARPFLFLVLSLALVAAVLPAWPGASRATDVGGIITVDATWTLAGSPYVATSTVAVQNGATLTIEPGVTVKFAAGAQFQIGSESNGGGTVVADAASGDPIVFTSAQASPAPGDWPGVRSYVNMNRPYYFSGGVYVTGTIFRNCVFEYAGGASVSTVFNHAGASPAFIDCTFRRSLGTTYLLYGGLAGTTDTLVLTRCTFSDNNLGVGNILTSHHAHLYNCRFTGNTANAVVTTNLGRLLMENTVVSDNPGSRVGLEVNSNGHMIVSCSVISRNGVAGAIAGIHVNSSTGACSLEVAQSIIQNNTPRSITVNGNVHRIDATNNWWGTTDTTAIAASLYDCRINSGRSCVVFTPILDTPTTCALTPVRPTSWGRLKRAYR
jgi:hypothetical protein